MCLQIFVNCVWWKTPAWCFLAKTFLFVQIDKFKIVFYTICTSALLNSLLWKERIQDLISQFEGKSWSFQSEWFYLNFLLILMCVCFFFKKTKTKTKLPQSCCVPTFVTAQDVSEQDFSDLPGAELQIWARELSTTEQIHVQHLQCQCPCIIQRSDFQGCFISGSKGCSVPSDGKQKCVQQRHN